jgi:hypothetical protein
MDFLNQSWVLYIYLFGACVWTLVVLGPRYSLLDSVASLIVGALWPVTMPARILSRTLS